MPRSGSLSYESSRSHKGLSSCDFDLIPKMTAPFELSKQQALLKVSYDFHIAGNGLYTMLVTTLKDSKTSKHVSILYQL